MLDFRTEAGDEAQAGTPIRRPQLLVDVARIRDAPVVFLTGEIDLATRDELRACLDELEGRIVVDLHEVPFLDCSALGVFAGTRKRLLKGGGDLRLRSPQDHVRRLLEITGLEVMVIDHINRRPKGRHQNHTAVVQILSRRGPGSPRG